jgi:acyl-CoA synthetase (AMP-forming)/AMP-acid ligase II
MAERALEHAASVDTVYDLLSPEYRGPGMIDVNGGVIDHAGLRAEVDRLADQLRALGLGAGDRIAIVLPNGPEMVYALLAAMAVGCAAPLNPKYREDEFRFYLDDLDAAALLALEGSATDARSATPDKTIVIDVRSEDGRVEFVAPDGAVTPPATSARPGPDDQALVLHTSGTTSRPKIVPLRQRNLAASARNIASSLELTESDRALAVMPLFHIHGIMASMLAPLSAGAAVIATTGFDAFKFHRWVADLQPTYYTAVPTMHQMVLARAGDRGNTSLRFVRSSSASLPGAVLDDLRTLFDVPVIEAYGMTEASHQMTCNPLPPRSTKPGSVGIPTGIEVTILDKAGNELPRGTRGEVSIKGPSVVDGYENNPTANESAFTNGWFRTGDEGMLDDDGYLFLTGRLKEQINRGGEKISPLEIDDVVLRHPEIAEAVAFAIPHDKLGEDVGLAAVRVAGSELSEKELRDYLSTQLAPFKLPRTIVFVDEIPKGATGKIQRIGLAGRLGL